MPEINQDFPLSAEARKEHLKAIMKDSKPISTVKVPGLGPKPVYCIPLRYLSYNPYNTRFLSQAKTWQKRLGRKLSNENPEDVKKIEEFLWEYKKDKNANTINSLLKEGQLQPGVVTLDGLILAGNRRFRLLNEIERNPQKYESKAGLQYFEAAIIDAIFQPEDIVQYESFYQYGAEDKVDYDPIQKYIAAHDQIVFNFSLKRIANNFAALTNGDTKIVEKWLEVYDLMYEYLKYIGEPEIFTALSETEESFLNLLDTKKSLIRGSTQSKSWAYDEMDIADLQLRYFDYIRAGKSTHEFRYFKKIFVNKDRWEAFNDKVLDTVNTALNDFPSIDEYRSKHPDDTEEIVSEKRKNEYIKRTLDALDDYFEAEKSYITSVTEEETPIKTARQAYQKLEKLLSLIDKGKIADIDELVEKVRDIQKITSKIEKIID